MIATWSPRVSRCRSRQLTEAFSVPSSYQVTRTAPVKSRDSVAVGLVIQAMRPACSAQKLSGSDTARVVIALCCAALTWACAAISGRTGKIVSDIVVFPLWTLQPFLQTGIPGHMDDAVVDFDHNRFQALAKA